MVVAGVHSKKKSNGRFERLQHNSLHVDAFKRLAIRISQDSRALTGSGNSFADFFVDRATDLQRVDTVADDVFSVGAILQFCIRIATDK